jgi:hypothetical protein
VLKARYFFAVKQQTAHHPINRFVTDAILLSMLTNEFWYGFLLGAGLVFFVFFVSRLIIRNRKEGR